MLRILAMTAVLLASGCLMGCQIFDPGGQVRRGRLQEDWATVGEHGFDHQTSGTKNVEAFYGTGEIQVEYDEDGNPRPAATSHFTTIAWFRPKTDEGITETMASFAEMSTQQSKSLNEMFGNVMSMMVPLLQARIPEPEPGVDTGDETGKRDELIDEILRRIGDGG